MPRETYIGLLAMCRRHEELTSEKTWRNLHTHDARQRLGHFALGIEIIVKDYAEKINAAIKKKLAGVERRWRDGPRRYGPDVDHNCLPLSSSIVALQYALINPDRAIAHHDEQYPPDLDPITPPLIPREIMESRQKMRSIVVQLLSSLESSQIFFHIPCIDPILHRQQFSVHWARDAEEERKMRERESHR